MVMRRDGLPERCPGHPKEVVEVRGGQTGWSDYNTLHQVLPIIEVIMVGMVTAIVTVTPTW